MIKFARKEIFFLRNYKCFKESFSQKVHLLKILQCKKNNTDHYDPVFP